MLPEVIIQTPWGPHVRFAQYAAGADETYTREEEALYQRFLRYFMRQHPRLAKAIGYGVQNPVTRENLRSPTLKEALEMDSAGLVSYAQAEAAAQYAMDHKVPIAVARAHMLGLTPRKIAGGHAAGMAVYAGHQDRAAVAQVAEAQALPDGEQNTMTRQQAEAAVQYANAHGVPYEDARQWALANVRG